MFHRRDWYDNRQLRLLDTAEEAGGDGPSNGTSMPTEYYTRYNMIRFENYIYEAGDGCIIRRVQNPGRRRRIPGNNTNRTYQR